MLPCTTVKFNMNNIIINITPRPITASTGMINSQVLGLEHFLHLDVPKTVLSPSPHCPQATPLLLDKHLSSGLSSEMKFSNIKQKSKAQKLVNIISLLILDVQLSGGSLNDSSCILYSIPFNFSSSLGSYIHKLYH